MNIKASIKRPLRLLWFRLRNVYYSIFGTDEYQKFVIISRSRTGSNLLISLLDSHPEINAFGEMFNLLHGKSSEWVWNGVFGHKTKGVKMVGFKIFYYHPQDSDDTWVWDRIYNDKSIPVIHLTRGNILRTFLSRQIAAKTKVWHDKSGNSKINADEKQVYLKPEECIAEFERTEKWENGTNEKLRGHKTLQITYEELTGEGQVDCLKKIQDFLNVRSVKLSSGMKRQNTEKLPDLISNFEELSSSLEGTEWERFLSEK